MQLVDVTPMAICAVFRDITKILTIGKTSAQCQKRSGHFSLLLSHAFFGFVRCSRFNRASVHPFMTPTRKSFFTTTRVHPPVHMRPHDLFKSISQCPSHVLRHLLRISPLPSSVLGCITSYCPLKTIGIFFLGYYIIPSALLWVMPRGCCTAVLAPSDWLL